MTELVLDRESPTTAVQRQRTAYTGKAARITDTASNVASVSFDRNSSSDSPLLRAFMQAALLVSGRLVERFFMDISTKVVRTYFGSEHKQDFAAAMIRLLVLERKGKVSDQKTSFLLDIYSKVNSAENKHMVDSKTVSSGLYLASELFDVCNTIDWYASPNNTLTFELLFDGKRATVIHGKMNSLVISNQDDMEWASYPITPEGIEQLKEKIKNF